MLVIRLFRVGKKNQPLFKIVVTDKRKPPRGGLCVEEVGFWNPLKKEKVLKQERIKYWLSIGAKPSDTIYNMLVSEKIIEGKKIPVHKKSKKKEETVPEATPATPKPEVAEVQKPIETPKTEKSAEEAKTEEKPAEVVPEVPKEEVKEEKAEDVSSEALAKEEKKE